MAKIVAARSFITSTIDTDAKGKPVTARIKHNGKEIEAPVTTRHVYSAGEVVTIRDRDVLASLRDGGFIRNYDPTLDGDPAEDDGNDPLA